MTAYDPCMDGVQTCTRPLPHVCTVNGPCNGWPKQDHYIGNQGRQDSQYDNSLAQWGLGDIHPSRRRRLLTVAGLTAIVATIVFYVCRYFYHR